MHYETRLVATDDGRIQEAIFAVFGGPEPGSNVSIPIPECQSKYFELQVVEGKGLGLVAKVTIPKGTIIISETAIMKIPRPKYLSDGVTAVMEAAKKMTQQQSGEFIAMMRTDCKVNFIFDWSVGGQDPISGCDPLSEDEALLAYHSAMYYGILMNNRSGFGPNTGLYPTIARMNHDCLPNCRYMSPNPKTNPNSTQIVANHEIQPGEELTITYRDVEHAFDYDLYWFLDSQYGFTCECKLCRDPITREKSMERRIQMNRLFQDLAFLRKRLLRELRVCLPPHLAQRPEFDRSDIGPMPLSVDRSNGDISVYKTIGRLRELMEEEGLSDGAVVEIYRFCYELMRIMYKARRVKGALEYLRRWRKLCEEAGASVKNLDDIDRGWA